MLGWPGWSPVYPFTDGRLGITSVQRWESGHSSQWAQNYTDGVFAIDITFEFIDTFLKSLALGPRGRGYHDNLGIAFIMERDGALIGTSRGKTSQLDKDALVCATSAKPGTCTLYIPYLRGQDGGVGANKMVELGQDCGGMGAGCH